MTTQQKERHAIGRLGERVIGKLFGHEPTNHKAPFDLVDFNSSVAYEVKTMSGLGKDLKIHINDNSMARKKGFAKEYGIKKMVLIAVVVYSPEKVEVYSSSLRQSVRVNQMKLISD